MSLSNILRGGGELLVESMAGRIVANELLAVAEDGGYGALDEVGRERLRNICLDFHQTCAKVNRERELETLHWRVQALAHGQNPESAPPTCDADSSTGCPANEGGSVPEAAHSANNVHTQKAAQLRVPMSKRACSWWRPEFWSIARPTDFCYGDCVWGFFESQPVMLTIPEWIRMLFVTTRRRSTMTASRQLKDSSEASSKTAPTRMTEDVMLARRGRVRCHGGRELQGSSHQPVSSLMVCAPSALFFLACH